MDGWSRHAGCSVCRSRAGERAGSSAAHQGPGNPSPNHDASALLPQPSITKAHRAAAVGVHAKACQDEQLQGLQERAVEVGVEVWQPTLLLAPGSNATAAGSKPAGRGTRHTRQRAAPHPCPNSHPSPPAKPCGGAAAGAIPAP